VAAVLVSISIGDMGAPVEVASIHAAAMRCDVAAITDDLSVRLRTLRPRGQ